METENEESADWEQDYEAISLELPFIEDDCVDDENILPLTWDDPLVCKHCGYALVSANSEDGIDYSKILVCPNGCPAETGGDYEALDFTKTGFRKRDF